MPQALPRRYRFGPYRLDTRTRELREGEARTVPLTAKAFDALVFLIEHRDRVVTRDELLAAVWPGRIVEENTLTQAIAAMRRALDAHEADHRYIVTFPGRGYRFVADVDDGDEAPSPSPPPPPGLRSASRPARRVRIVVVCGLLLLVGAVVAWRWTAAPAMRDVSQVGLAVLPFRALGPGDHDALLELGLADTLITRVSNSTSMRVRSLASSQRVASRDPIDAGSRLGARYVIEGTVQRSGPRVRVSARLLDVGDGSTVWSGTMDDRADRAFTLQDRLADALVGALDIETHGGGTAKPCDGADAGAYRAYLAGRYQFERPSGPAMRKALASFRRAIELDPTCARAYAGMAFAHRTLVMAADADPRVHFPLAKAAIDRALALDPGLAEAYASQGFVRFWYDWDWTGSEASLKRAISLNPSLAEAHLAYAHLLLNIGRTAESATHARHAIELDPLSPLLNTLGSTMLYAGGFTEEADRTRARVLDVEPDFWIALLTRSGDRMARGDHAGAVLDLERAAIGCGQCSQILAVLGRAYVQAGRRDKAEALLADMERRARDGYLPPTSIAAVRNALGDRDGALDLLEQGLQERDVRMPFLRIDGRWNNLRDDPRFKAVEAAMRFPPLPEGQ